MAIEKIAKHEHEKRKRKRKQEREEDPVDSSLWNPASVSRRQRVTNKERLPVKEEEETRKRRRSRGL